MSDNKNAEQDNEQTQNFIDNEQNQYQNAANRLKEYAVKNNIDISSAKGDIDSALGYFQKTYAPEVLEKLDDSTLLSSIFITAGNNANSLCYWLEYNKECKKYFGSILGGSSYKYGLFQKKEKGRIFWVSGSSRKHQEISEEEALKLGKEIRDVLVNGVRIIRKTVLNTVEAYEKLDQELKEILGERFYNWGWVHKYFSIICNDKLSGFHTTDWQEHVLRALGIKPSGRYYARSGQISMIQNHADWCYFQFYTIFDKRFGGPRQFFRISSMEEGKDYSELWEKKGVVGIGKPGLGDLRECIVDKKFEKEMLQDELVELYYQDDEKKAGKEATDIKRWFCECNSNTVFVIMNGEQLIALADHVGENYFDPDAEIGNLRSAEWKYVFPAGEKLPDPKKGKLTICYKFSDEENLMFLYNKYYYGEEYGQGNFRNSRDEEHEEIITTQSIRYNTNYQSKFDRNRIVFGAPGTGKSYLINQEKDNLIGEDNEDDYERVTFHPDYSYANFVGTYKPVSYKDNNENDSITYKYVPGPFMRVLVKALKNAMTDNPRPFLLIIEEINRADMAAVFGDVFQLLDRGDDNVSEYPIEASEDMKKYLADKLDVNQEICSKIRIPDNMFIWATMNSADQGVFPMDTAFKRRWDFTYRGIDASEKDLKGKCVELGKGEYRRSIEWNRLRKAINKFLSDIGINEDKQLGPYFIARKIVVPEEGDKIKSEDFIHAFKDKVLMYLFEDAARQRRSELFFGSTMRYSEICKDFEKKGIKIFCQSIVDEYDRLPNE